MRPPRAAGLVLLLTYVALVSGCIDASDPGEATPVEAAEPATSGNVTVAPEVRRFAGDMLPGADPFILADGSICSPSAQCHVFPLTFNRSVTMDAVLSWTLEANDLDMHLVQDGVVLRSGSTLPPGRSEWLVEVPMEPGAYELVVVGFVSTVDAFDILVQFS